MSSVKMWLVNKWLRLKHLGRKKQPPGIYYTHCIPNDLLTDELPPYSLIDENPYTKSTDDVLLQTTTKPTIITSASNDDIRTNMIILKEMHKNRYQRQNKKEIPPTATTPTKKTSFTSFSDGHAAVVAAASSSSSWKTKCTKWNPPPSCYKCDRDLRSDFNNLDCKSNNYEKLLCFKCTEHYKAHYKSKYNYKDQFNDPQKYKYW